MTPFRTMIGIGAISMLSACNLATLFDEPTEADLAARAFAAAVENTDAFGSNGADGLRIYRATQGQPVTSASQFAPLGKAEYDGQIGLGDITGNGVVGDLTLSASFGASPTIGGGARNFVDRENRSVDGVLTVSPGSININADPEVAWQFTPGISGTLVQDGANRNVSAQLNGEFLGSTAGLIAGEVFDTDPAGNNSGFFVAQRR